MLFLLTSCKYGLGTNAEAAERNPDKNKYKAAAAVFSLLVFCVARFVSYWTAAKGREKEEREGAFLPPFWCFSKSLPHCRKKAARNN